MLGSSSILLLQICFCSCTSFRPFGDKLSMGEQGVLMSSVEPALSEAIDPCLRWERLPKGRRKNGRRPRTSLTGLLASFKSSTPSHDIHDEVPKRTGRKKSTAKGVKRSSIFGNKGPKSTGASRKKSRANVSKENLDPTDKGLRKAGDMLFSDFEKLGVSILGRRFSDIPEYSPIQNRNINLDYSQLLPRQLGFDLVGSCNQTEDGHGIISADRNANRKERNEMLYEVPDFSGISLLAATACGSAFLDGVVNIEDSVSKICSSEENGASGNNKPLSSSDIEKVRLLSTSGGLEVKTSTATIINNDQNMVNGLEVGSQNYKFAWDLNVPAESLEDTVLQTVNADPLVTDDATAEHFTCDDMTHEEPYKGQVEHSTSHHIEMMTLADGALEGFKVPEEATPVVKLNVATEMEWTSPVGTTADPYPPFVVSVVEIDPRPPCVVVTEDVSTDTMANVSVSLPKMASVTDVDVCDGVCLLTEGETQAEKCASLGPGSDIGKREVPAAFIHHAEDASDVILARTSACQFPTVAAGVSDDTSHIEVLDIRRNFDDNSKLEISSCLADSHPFTCIGSSNHDELSSGSTSTAGHVTAMDVMMKNKRSAVADENPNTTKSGGSLYIVPNSSTCGLADTLPRVALAPPTDGALSSHGTCKSNVDSFVNSPDEVVKGVHSDCGYDSHASRTSIGQVAGLDKHELLSDDDSQYEEGEFRGSIDIQAEDDEEDDECVDYGSDSTMDAEAAALTNQNVDRKYTCQSEIDAANCDVPRMARDAYDTASQPYRRSSSVKDACDSGCGKGSPKSLTMFDASSVGESLRIAVGTPPRKYLSPRGNMPEFSDASRRREGYYAKASRSGEAGEPNIKFGDVNNVRSFRTDRRSQIMHNNDRREHRVDSRNHWDLESRGYHGPCNFTHSSSKNAAAAVAAKLESNGFVISPDGTIVKVGGARRPNYANASSQRTRDSIRRRSPIGRGGSDVMQRGRANWKAPSSDRYTNASRGRTDGYGHVNSGYREKYHVSRSRPCTSSSRSRTRSPIWRHPSESNDRGMDRNPVMRWRSRSPCFNTDGMNQRIKSQRQVKTRSPVRRSGFKGMGEYVPSVGNHSSPLHTSKWTDDKLKFKGSSGQELPKESW